MLLGVYSIYLKAVSSLYIPILIPLGIGVILGGFCFMKLTKFLLVRFYAPTFFCIIGFTIGSIFVLLPSFSSYVSLLIGILSCFLRLLHGISFGKFSRIKIKKTVDIILFMLYNNICNQNWQCPFLCTNIHLLDMQLYALVLVDVYLKSSMTISVTVTGWKSHLNSFLANQDVAINFRLLCSYYYV